MAYEQLNEKILELKDEMFQSIKESIAICSVRGEAEEDAPYGREVKKALDHALALGESMGFRTGNVDNKVGYIEYGDGEEMAAVLGHLDVVPLGDGWDYDPLGCEIHDGNMYARGIVDDKGPTIGAMYALKAIKDLGLPIDRRIRVIFGCDEENGSSCVDHYIKVGGELPTIGFTPDAQFPAIFCEKGQSFWALHGPINQESDIKILKFEGGLAKNVVAPQCVLEVEGDLKVKDLPGISVERADGKTTVTAEGVSAHGSLPEMGKNAIALLLDAVSENKFGGDIQKYIDFLINKIGYETDGNTLGIKRHDEETGDTTVNLGVVSYRGNELFVELDIRYPKGIDENYVLAHVMEQIQEASYEATYEAHELLYVPTDSELIQKLMKVYSRQTGERDVKPIAIGGGTYAKAFKNMVAYGPFFPDEEDAIHCPNECINIEKFVKAIQITAAAMYEIAQK